MSSARISASFSLPKLVRSPHNKSTSAWLEISLNSSRWGGLSPAGTWRSPIAAARIGRSLPILLLKIADRVGEAPLVDVDCIIARGEDTAAADLLARALHPRLVAKALEQ